MLRLKDLRCGYASLSDPVVCAPPLDIAPGSFVCVIGRNGAGKSTLMRTIAGLQRPVSGCALLDDREIAHLSARERAREISVVTTERVSSPGLYASDVVELGRQPFTDWQGRLGADDIAAINDALTRTKAAIFSRSLFDALSDGERQRVMIARAIAQAPRLMVLDEITAFLDLPGRVEIMSLLRRHARNTGTVVLMSSHDLELSLELADILWVVENGGLHFGEPQDDNIVRTIASTFNSTDVHFDTGQRRFVLSRNDASVSKDA